MIGERLAGDRELRHANEEIAPLDRRTKRPLDEIGASHGTWLSSAGRDCLARWEPLLAPLRDERFDLLEIGLGAGASLRTWRDWFPRARIVGFDARRVVLDPPIPGCRIVQGNQTDLIAFQPLLREYEFRVIVADGSLHDDDQIRTFTMLFPWMAPDSLYFCVGFDAAGAPAKRDAAEWFAELGLALLRPRVREECLRDQPDLDVMFHRLKGVQFTRASVVIAG